MKRLILIITLFVTACSDKSSIEMHITDQCLRRELFNECMKSLPAGPTSIATSNDWDEVVSECKNYSHYTASRYSSMVKKECQ